MTTSKLACILGLALIIGSSLVSVDGKRQLPNHDEIERIINATHSVIWKCLNTECHPGTGLNVHCGTSISIDIPIKCVPCVKGVNYSSSQDYSTCKSCKNCAKHENKAGECTLEKDTTECLGTCNKGFYMGKITEDCQPCSDCCNIVMAKKHHEEQCEDSGLPPYQQCRQFNIKCPHPTKPVTQPAAPPPKRHQGALAIALPSGIFFFILLIVFLVLWRCFGWEKIQSALTKWCCCCCRLILPARGNTVSLYASDQYFEGDLEAALLNVSGNHLTEDGDVLTNLSSLSGAKTVRRPMFRRLHSVPVQAKKKSEIPRSFSHPGALNDLAKFDKGKGTLSFKSGFKKQVAQKHTKKGIYTLVETEPLVIGNLVAEREDRESFRTLATSGELVRFTMGADDIMAQEPDNKAPAPMELLEIDDVSADLDNHDDNNCGGAVPVDVLQAAAGSMITDAGKERLEKRSDTEVTVMDQCTSTTQLHISSTTTFADIPQDFLNCLLSERMSAIKIEFTCKIYKKLDIPRELHWDDYRLLAEKIGLDSDVILWLGEQNNRTKFILEKFDAQEDPSIRRFKEILEEMGRNDVVTVIKNWALFQWKEQNNNSSLVW